MGALPAVAPAGIVDPLPQVQVAAEFAAVVVKLGMRLVGLGLQVHGAVAHVLHAQSAGDDQHFVQRLPITGFQNHAAYARVERQLGELFASGGQLVRVVHCAQLGQQLVAVSNRPALGFFEEGEVFHDAQVQRLHAQDHPGQRAAQNFGVGKTRAAVEVGLVV